MAQQTAGSPSRYEGSARPHARTRSERWATALTHIEPNTIVIRGYPVDELMGRLSFGEAVYLILRGELPSPSIGQLFSAALVASLDHGVTPPSTLAARNAATTGASIGACVAAGILGLGVHHGADVGACMGFLAERLRRLHEGMSMSQLAEEIVRDCARVGHPPPGFGHRIHSKDPRAIRLLQMAHELELDGEHVHLIRAIERAIASHPDCRDHPAPLNVNGAIAAVCADLGFDADLGNALFVIARVPGLVAHAHEERVRHPPMRQIEPRDHLYDGPPVRRLPETRK